MTQRIIETAQVHATNVFSGYIRDELTNDELLTPSNISRITFKRFRIVRSLIGNGDAEIEIDPKEIQIDPNFASPCIKYNQTIVSQKLKHQMIHAPPQVGQDTIKKNRISHYT
jgi:hypothetical protein